MRTAAMLQLRSRLPSNWFLSSGLGESPHNLVWAGSGLTRCCAAKCDIPMLDVKRAITYLREKGYAHSAVVKKESGYCLRRVGS